MSIKTLGDLIRIKRYEKLLTRWELAQKMGIATATIRAWEGSIRWPDSQQLEVLSSVLGFGATDFETHNKNPLNCPKTHMHVVNMGCRQ